MLCGQSQLIVKVNKQQLFLFNRDSHFESLRTPKIRKFVTVRMRPHPVAHPHQPLVSPPPPPLPPHQIMTNYSPLTTLKKSLPTSLETNSLLISILKNNFLLYVYSVK